MFDIGFWGTSHDRCHWPRCVFFVGQSDCRAQFGSVQRSIAKSAVRSVSKMEAEINHEAARQGSYMSISSKLKRRMISTKLSPRNQALVEGTSRRWPASVQHPLRQRARAMSEVLNRDSKDKGE